MGTPQSINTGGIDCWGYLRSSQAWPGTCSYSVQSGAESWTFQQGFSAVNTAVIQWDSASSTLIYSMFKLWSSHMVISQCQWGFVSWTPESMHKWSAPDPHTLPSQPPAPNTMRTPQKQLCSTASGAMTGEAYWTHRHRGLTEYLWEWILITCIFIFHYNIVIYVSRTISSVIISP